MGAAVATGADLAWLTNDNPRSEDPADILAAMLTGAQQAGGAARIVVEPDRRTAIAAAVAAARAGDVVVVAGKGHEQGQEFADHAAPFDDRSVLGDVLGPPDSTGVAP
jgi:UDP-N-acetylmuramoyl-L-alanyl-D-glutamate--2,6-diaminopimelate ligase